MLQKPFYDPTKSYEDNFDHGPFGAFAGSEVVARDAEPQVEFLGHNVYLPFGIPAGPLINGAYVKAAFAKGFDLCVYKTVRSREYPCHQHPNVLSVKLDGDLTMDKAKRELVADDNYAEPLSITNSFGVPSKPVDWWQEDMVKAVTTAGKGQVMIGSFQGTKKEGGGTAQDLIDDYVTTAKLVKETGAKILAANLSCPNEGTADLLCFDVPRVQSIAEGIKNEIGDTPLLMKFAYFEKEEHLEDLVQSVGSIINGFIAINTIPAKIVNEAGEQALPGQGRERSGVCGAGIKWAGLDMTKRLVALRERHDMDFSVIGVGGVMNKEDYQEYREAGADAVLSATGAMWNPYLAKEIGENNS